MKKTLIVSLSTLVLLSGCSINVKVNDTSSDSSSSNQQSTNPFLEVSTSEEPTVTEEAVQTEEPATASQTVEYADMKITIKDGWSYSKEFMNSDFRFDSKSSIQVPVIKVYKGDANDSNPYVVFSSFDPMEELGGLYEYKHDYGNKTYGNYTYYVTYNNYAPYNAVFSKDRSEDWYEYSGPITSLNGAKRYIHVSYFDHGTSGYEDGDVIDMISSLEITNKLGKITVTADNLNVRSDANKDATRLWLAHKGGEYEVYEVRSDNGYTWYRIGAYSWVADQNGEWVKYSQY